jgi:hypothetical protein
VPVTAQIQHLRERIGVQLAGFEHSPSQAKRALREMLGADAKAFFLAVLPMLTEGAQQPGVAFLYELLAGKNLLPPCDPELVELADEIRISREAVQMDPLLDVKLARRIAGSTVRGSEQIDPSITLRTLEVLETISDGSRILPMLIQVLREPDPRLRSKAALLIGRTTRSAQWADQLLREPDARVRANSIQALWGVESEAIRGVFWAAIKDVNNRVQGNALLGLYHLGEAAAIGPILRMAKHSSPTFRATAAWVMGETGDPRFLPALGQMIRESDTRARHSVFRAIARLKKAVAQYASAPALRVHVCQISPQPEDAWLVRAGVASPDGNDIPGLLPTAFVLTSGNQMVSDYTMRESRPPDWLVLGVALPAKRNCPQGNGEMIEQAVQSCLTMKGSGERWAILRFSGPREEASPPNQPEPQEPPACVLTTETDPLKAGLADTENRFLYADVMQSLLATVGQATGSRNLLVLEDRTADSKPPEIHPARWAALVRDAQGASVAIHAVLLRDCSRPAGMLLDVASQTGGMCLATNDPQQLPALCEKLHFCLLHPYEILCGAGQPERASPLKLQVYSEQGYGEDILVVPECHQAQETTPNTSPEG